MRKRKYEISDCEVIRVDKNSQEQTTIRISVQKALLKVPELQRIVIVLKFYQGMRYKEISEVLGCPLGTVKTRMHNGLKKMRKLLRITLTTENTEKDRINSN